MIEKDHKGFWQKRLERLEPTVRSVQLKYNITGGDIVAIHDQGKYGSNSYACPPGVCSRIKADFLKTLDRIGGRVVYYEPKDFGDQPDTVFASLGVSVQS